MHNKDKSPTQMNAALANEKIPNGYDDPYNTIARLTAIGMALSAETDIDKLLEMILNEAKDISGADGGTLYLRTEQDELVFSIIHNSTLGIHRGGSAPQAPGLKPIPLYKKGMPNSDIQAVSAVLSCKPISIDDIYEIDVMDLKGTKAFDEENSYRTKSVCTIPMVNHAGHAVGCLQLVNAKDRVTGEVIPFTRQSQDILMSLTSQAAIILDNKQLIAQQAALLESFIKLIAKAIDEKSPYTGEHCERVPVLSEMLAEAGCRSQDGIFADFDLTPVEKYELHIAGWLHDCGKVVTPVHIMDKATKLETINDRIELVKARYEILARDVLIETQDPREHAARHATLNEELAFLIKANIGGEFMSDDDIARLSVIGKRTVTIGGKVQPLLTEDEIHHLSTRRGTITASERKIMNDHMVHTVNMLEALPFPRHLKRVPEYACGHHERMDGKGYPKGIPAGDMSIPARMMAVADVFEALTASDRPYKPAKKLSEAMKIIGSMKKEHHLDPDMVDLLIKEKVYLDYARRYLAPELIDAVDEAAILAIVPNPR